MEDMDLFYKKRSQTNNYFILDSESYLSNTRKYLENKCIKCGLGKHLIK